MMVEAEMYIYIFEVVLKITLRYLKKRDIEIFIRNHRFSSFNHSQKGGQSFQLP